MIPEMLQSIFYVSSLCLRACHLAHCTFARCAVPSAAVVLDEFGWAVCSMGVTL